MQIVTSLTAAATIEDPEIRQRVLHTLHSIADDIPFDNNLHGYILVVGAEDTADSISQHIGWNILTNRHTGMRYDKDGYTPDCELLLRWDRCFEMLHLRDDSGYCISIWIPAPPALPPIDADLIAMCQAYATVGQS
jgi:hypothetical protein